MQRLSWGKGRATASGKLMPPARIASRQALKRAAGCCHILTRSTAWRGFAATVALCCAVPTSVAYAQTADATSAAASSDVRTATSAKSDAIATQTSRKVAWRSPDDGDFDASDFLLNHRGALPVPMIITEPAIGYGGGVALMFFSESMADVARNAKETGVMSPPNITAVGGLYTENGTWGAGLMHFHTWGGDSIRYLGGLAKVNMKTDYYGLSNSPRSYQLNGWLLVQQVLFRIGKSHWFVGPRYTYFDSNTHFTGQIAQEVGLPGVQRRIGKVGLVIDYDSRDNMFFPDKGSYLELEIQAARPWAGSSQSFETYNGRGYTWLPLARDWILGLRLDGRFSAGDTPFYAQPYVKLRGVQQGRYQDQNAAMVEAELRWNVTPRWAVLGFSGAGRAWGKWKSFSEADAVVSVGAGFRYLIAAKLGLAVGVDVAHSKGENAFYIQVGSAWR
ncbi:BamA/TamA family outer membrane protein [Pandoraea faecigallinarum]|uniref:BamA/TamA family outer membrane protein n=1 Tax=Pandoraea faecigallinarum TaxID=656179 RepID=UPI000A9B022A|nr:BamA/TamA family outer membrane protein [Pandoraea faecigallinarum]